MLIESRQSTEPLQEFIREYYFFSNLEDAAKYIPVIDDCCYDFIFFKEANSALHHGMNQQKLSISSQIFTIHALSPPFKIQLGTSTNFFTIKVQPWMNKYFFNDLPHIGIVDLTHDLQYMDFHHKVFESDSLEERFLLADQLMISKNLALEPSTKLVKEICNYVYKRKGLVSVNEISEQFQRSRQYLGKVFKACVMYSLKKFITTVRILDLIQYKRNHPELSLTELCYQYNYFDQPHFIKDFKQVCGVTPTVFFGDIPKFLLRH